MCAHLQRSFMHVGMGRCLNQRRPSYICKMLFQCFTVTFILSLFHSHVYAPLLNCLNVKCMIPLTSSPSTHPYRSRPPPVVSARVCPTCRARRACGRRRHVAKLNIYIIFIFVYLYICFLSRRLLIVSLSHAPQYIYISASNSAAGAGCRGADAHSPVHGRRADRRYGDFEGIESC
jgi:hypothetical protein